MWGNHNDQNSEKHLKTYKVVKQQTCPLKQKCKYLEWFWLVTEGITLLTRKKHYIEDCILKTSKIKIKTL